MTKLYAVTSGEYADYRVDAIFDDKTIADQWMAVYGGDDIAEYTLNPGVKEMKEGLALYQVLIKRNGDCHLVSTVNPESVMGDVRLFWERNMLRVLTWATDQSHAVKIANEKRTQLLTNNVWRDDWFFGPVEQATPAHPSTARGGLGGNAKTTHE